MTVEVLPATGEAWDDVTAVFATTGDSGHCWCQWFHLGTRAWQQTPVEQRRAALERQVRGGVRAPGVIASVDGEPAGWCAVAPRASYVRLRASRKLAAAGVALDAADARALQAASVKRVEHADHHAARPGVRHFAVQRAAHLEHDVGGISARRIGDLGA